MESSILTFLNIKLDSFIVAVSVMTIIMLITLFFLLLDYLKIRKRYMEFMTGESGKNLEYTIYKRFREIDELKVGQKDNDDQIAIIYDMVRKSYNKFGLYRYDAFNLQNSFNGGSISFALTMLNSSDNGFILNVIHNRAGCHVYVKEIVNGECETVLAREEQISLNMAMKKEVEAVEQEEVEENKVTVEQENIAETEETVKQENTEESKQEEV
ncbi:MAG TPA: DUF4446 domain-containing protein [Eubacterium sp.]|nr:DUF4446 domain-containing protein [Eubacterium sp.]